MADRLGVYNSCLTMCGERQLASLTEDREPRRLLDAEWAGGAVNRCLEDGQWPFARRTVQLDYDPSVTPQWGYNRAYNKPSDWVLTSAFCSDEFLRVPVTQYRDEGAYWFGNLDTVYVTYISNSDLYGMNIGNWPQSFADFVSAHLASRIIYKMSASEERVTRLKNERKEFLTIAKNKAAAAEPPSFPARGTWSNSRIRGNYRNDGGNTGSLLG